MTHFLFFVLSLLFFSTDLFCSENSSVLFEGNIEGVAYRFYRVKTSNIVSIRIGINQDTFSDKIPYLNPALKRLHNNLWGKKTNQRSEEEIKEQMIDSEFFEIEERHIKVSRKNLFKALELHAELTENLAADKEKFVFHQNCLREEVLALEKDVVHKINQNINSHLYANMDHPSLRPLTLQEIESVKFEDLEIFKNKNFPNESYLITGCGNLTKEEFEKVVSFIVKDTPKCQKGTKFEDFKVKETICDKQFSLEAITQAQVVLSYPFPKKIKLNSKLYKHLTIIGTALRIGGIDSLLLSTMRGKYGLYCANFEISMSDYGASVLGTFNCSPEDVDKLTHAYKDTLRQIQKSGFDKELFEQAKMAIIVEAERTKTSAEYISWILLDSLEREVPLDESLDIKKRYDDITLEEVNETLKKYLDVDKFNRFVILPKEREETIKG